MCFFVDAQLSLCTDVVSVARPRILIYPAWLSQPLLSPSNKQEEFIRPSHSIHLRHLHTVVQEPVQCRFTGGRDLSAIERSGARRPGARRAHPASEHDASTVGTTSPVEYNVGTTA